MKQENLLEEKMATHCRYPCLDNSMDRGTWWESIGLQRVEHNLATEHTVKQ